MHACAISSHAHECTQANTCSHTQQYQINYRDKHIPFYLCYSIYKIILFIYFYLFVYLHILFPQYCILIAYESSSL